MDGSGLQYDLALAGPRKGAQGAGGNSLSLLGGTGRDDVVNVGNSDEHDSLFGDADMESLFGSVDDDDDAGAGSPLAPAPSAFSLPLPVAHPLPPLPFPMPAALPSADAVHMDRSNSFCDVSTTLFPELDQGCRGDGQAVVGRVEGREGEQGEAGREEQEMASSHVGLSFSNLDQHSLGVEGLSGFDFHFDTGAYTGAGANFDFNVDLELDMALDLGLQREANEFAREEIGQGTGKGAEAEAEADAEAAWPARQQLEPTIDTPSQAIGLAGGASTAAIAIRDDDGQEGMGQRQHHGTHRAGSRGTACAAASNPVDNSHMIIDLDTASETDDIVVLSERKVDNRFAPKPASRPSPDTVPASLQASIPHHLELRPRCPQTPPPQRIDLNGFNVEELLPYVQLHSKLSMRGIQQLLGLDVDAGRSVVAECRRHLADPAHTIVLSGTCDPAALRILKVTLILSSLALLNDGQGQGGVGERWFGRSSPLEPRSMHVWPDDSTTLTLLFIQLLYRLTRNNSVRDRQRKNKSSRETTPTHNPHLLLSSGLVKSNSRKRAPRSSMPISKLQPASLPPTPSTTPSPPPQPAPTGSVTPMVRRALARPLWPTLTYNSPSVLRETLISSVDKKAGESRHSSVSRSQSPVATGTGTSTCAGTPRRPPTSATLRYLVNVVGRGSQRVVPQITLAHEGPIRGAGYSHLVGLCARLDQQVATVSIVTLLGLEKVGSDADWDRIVCRVHDEMLMDGEVRVLLCLQ